MSPIGRIFILINALLAAVFLGAAASFLASTDRYRSSFEGEVQAKKLLKDSLEADIAGIQEQKAEADRLREEIRNKNTQLETRLTGLNADLSEQKIANAGLSESNSSFTSSLDNINSSLGSVTEQASKAQADTVAALEAKNEAINARQEALSEKEAAQDKVNEMTATIAALEADLKSKNDEVMSLSTTLETVVASTGISLGEITAAPKIDGAVLSVTNAQGANLVFINRGKTDNVKVGFVFEIFQGTQYKGQARVEIVHDSNCTARMITANPGTSVMQGDRASTRI